MIVQLNTCNINRRRNAYNVNVLLLLLVIQSCNSKSIRITALILLQKEALRIQNLQKNLDSQNASLCQVLANQITFTPYSQLRTKRLLHNNIYYQLLLKVHDIINYNYVYAYSAFSPAMNLKGQTWTLLYASYYNNGKILYIAIASG